MKKNFTKVLVASTAMATLGLAYAANVVNIFDPEALAQEPEALEMDLTWGIEDGVLSEDMVALGVPVNATNVVVPEGVNPMDFNITLTANLYTIPAPVESEDDVDPGFNVTPAVCVAEEVAFPVNFEGGYYTSYLFPEVLEVGQTYAIQLVKTTVVTENGATFEFPLDYVSPDFTVGVVEEGLVIAPAFIAGEEQIALNDHSAVSVECAEALVVRFVNGVDVKTATYAIDEVEEDNAISLASGELSINTIGYVAFETPLTFVSGHQYKLTIKAWDTTEIVDENLAVAEPLACVEYCFNGAAAAGIIGEPAWGVERGEFPEDMAALGVPVRFPELVLPFGVVAEECEITVSASLYGIPEGNEPALASEDEDIDPGMGVDGPVCLAEAQLHYANVEGGVVTAYLFPEMLEAGNHYAIILNAVTVADAEGNVVAELPEEAYYATDFVVAPYVAPIELGFAEFVGIENGVVDVEDTMINGIKVTFPGANFGTDDAVVSVMATLYDVTEMGEVAGDDDVDNMGVVGPVAVAQNLFVGGLNVESGIYEVALFTEQFVAGRKYVISLETITVESQEGEVILSWDNVEEEWASEVFEVISTALEIAPAFIAGEEQIALNAHSAVSVECAEALVVRFINGVDVKVATYAIDEVEEDNAISLASGELSINTLGYVAFETPLTFVSGHQYKLTIKAWDTTEIVDENLVVAEPLACVEYCFNGASAAGIIGEPVWGVERGEFPEDMAALGVPVRFPELVLPFGVVAEECEITVSASLYGIPEGNEPALASEDDDIDPGMGVDGPVALAEAVLHVANVEGGVATAYLFPEMLEADNHYAIILNAVTVVDAEGNVVAELPEDAYYATDFVVTPYVAPIELGFAEFLGIEDGVVDVENTVINGIKVAFPAANFGTEDAVLSVMATLYDVTDMGQLAGDDVDNMGVVGPIAVAQDLFVGGLNVESGIYEVALFTEQFVAGRKYVISLETITAETAEGEVILQWDNVEEEWASDIFEVISTALEIEPAFVAGEDEVALNAHSAVSVETAEALVVRFVNGAAVKYATYAIDEYSYDEEEGAMVWTDQLGSGALSLSTVGYIAFDEPLVFVAGKQYVLTVKAWDVAEIFDENWNMAQPIAVEEYTFNGASATGVIGEPEWGIDRFEFPEDMIALGVPVRFPELSLPFGVVAEDCEITVSASLYGIPEGNEPSVISEDDDIDPGMGVDGPVTLAEAVLHPVSLEGGVATAYLFPEMLEVGNHYAIVLNAVTVVDAEGNVVAELPEDAYYAVDFVVVANGGTTGIEAIGAENNAVMYNLNGQKVNRANGIVILNGAKVLVK